MENRNIRTYDFSIPGNTERHIPGIPGTWPAGSRVTIDEDTKEVLSVWPEKQDEATPDAPPALEKSAKAK